MTAPAILSYGRPRRRLARVPLLFRARDCEDEDGIFALSYGKRVGLVHTRAGANGLATMSDESGRLVRVPSDWPRLSWEMTSAGSRVRTLLTERAHTNLLSHSEQLDNAVWSKSDTTVTANSIAAPDGTLTADLITEGSAGTAFFTRNVVVSSGATVVYSRFMRRGNHDWVRVNIVNPSAPGTDAINVWFNLATGVRGTLLETGIATGALARIEAYDAFYRVVVSGALTGLTTYQIGTFSAASDGSSTRVSNATRYEWGVNVLESALPGSYIPSEASTAARTADSAYFPLLCAPQELTALLQGVNVGAYPDSVSARRLLHVGDANVLMDPRFALFTSAAQSVNALYDDGIGSSVTALAALSSAPVWGDALTMRGVLHADGSTTIGGSLNDGAEITAVSGGALTLPPAWAAARAYLTGGLTSTNGGFGYQSLVLDYGTRERDELRELVEVA